jgi:hypothetical protein
LELFTIGGAVFEDEKNPLFSGVEGITVRVIGADGGVICSTVTGAWGLWKIDSVATGAYTVVYGHGGETSGHLGSIDIVVKGENKAANQSIKWVYGHDAPRPAKPQRVAPRGGIERGRSE